MSPAFAVTQTNKAIKIVKKALIPLLKYNFDGQEFIHTEFSYDSHITQELKAIDFDYYLPIIDLFYLYNIDYNI